MAEKRKNTVIYLASIILAAIMVRFLCFAGFVGLDDAEYARFAYRLWKDGFTIGAYQGPAVFPLRVGIIAPTSLSFSLFGVSEFSMVFYILALSIISVVLSYVITTHFFGTRAGLIAALVFAFLPIDLTNSTRLYPDLPSAFFASVGVALILAGLNKDKKPLLFALGLVSGLSFGISWLCKENIAYLAPFCLFLFFYTVKGDNYKNIPLWGGVAVGALSVIIIESVVYWSLIGDPLFRSHEVERNYQQWKNGFFTEGSKFGWDKNSSYMESLLRRLFIVGPKTIFLNGQFLYTPFLGAIAAAYGFYRRDKSFYIPSVWLVTLALMFNFASSSTSSYIPLPLFHRYLYLIVMPAVVLAAGLISRVFLESSFKSGSGGILISRVALTPVIILMAYESYLSTKYSIIIKSWADEAKVISRVLKPTDNIYTDVLSIKALEFYWKYPDAMNTVDFEGVESSEGIESGSYVLINRRYVGWLQANTGMWLSKYPETYYKPPFYDEIPAGWRALWKDSTVATLYEVR